MNAKTDWFDLAKSICVEPIEAKHRPMSVGLAALERYCDTTEERMQADLARKDTEKAEGK